MILFEHKGLLLLTNFSIGMHTFLFIRIFSFSLNLNILEVLDFEPQIILEFFNDKRSKFEVKSRGKVQFFVKLVHHYNKDQSKTVYLAN